MDVVLSLMVTHGEAHGDVSASCVSFFAFLAAHPGNAGVLRAPSVTAAVTAAMDRHGAVPNVKPRGVAFFERLKAAK